MKTAKGTTAAPSPIKVCMHVLNAVRNDVRVMREAVALKEEGFAVTIVDVEGECNQPVEEEIQGIWVKHIIMPRSFYSADFDHWTLTRAVQVLTRSILRLIQTPADIYHGHDIPGLIPCYITARLHHKPLIFDAHELPLDNMSSGLFYLVKMLFARFFGGILACCAGIITVSPPIAQALRNRYHIPSVSLVRNVPAYRRVSKSDRLRQYLELKPEVRIVLYQGFLLPDRGLDALIRSAAFLEPDIVIVLMGRGFGDTPSRLEAVIVSEGVSDRVKIIPPVPYAELLDWTASADIGLITYLPDVSLNIRWCLPNKFFEYLMAGLPVLASPLDAISAIIRTYDVGQIVSSLTPKDIAAAINTMLADPAALASMSRNALQASQADLCWEKERKQLIHLYRNVLAIPDAKSEDQKISSNSTICSLNIKEEHYCCSLNRDKEEVLMGKLFDVEGKQGMQVELEIMDELWNREIVEYFREKTILVTGAAGFVGRHLVRHLHALGAQVIALDRTSGESLPGVQWVVADVLELTPKHFEGARLDMAFHLASIVGVTYTGQNPTLTLAVNAIGTSQVLKLARALGAKAICLTSSSEVYGEPEVVPLTEDSHIHPLSIYGWSKVCAEQLLEAHAQSGDLCGVVIRPFNVYGPGGQRAEFVVSRFLQLAMQGLPPTIVGTGKQQRVFTFVDDLIYGMLLAVMKGKPGYHVYNIAGDEVMSIADLAELIVSITGSSARPVHVQVSDLERDVATEVVVRIASTEKARRELGYRPRISLEEGLRITYEQLSLESMKVSPR